MARPLIDMREEYVRCRTLGHAWDDLHDHGYRASFGWLLAFRCTRCTMVRLDVIDALGRLGSRRYVQPEGYRLESKIPRDDFRRELRFRVYSAREMLEAVNG